MKNGQRKMACTAQHIETVGVLKFFSGESEMSFAWFLVMSYLVGAFLSAVLVGSACAMSGQIADQMAKLTTRGMLISDRLRKSC